MCLIPCLPSTLVSIWYQINIFTFSINITTRMDTFHLEICMWSDLKAEFCSRFDGQRKAGTLLEKVLPTGTEHWVLSEAGAATGRSKENPEVRWNLILLLFPIFFLLPQIVYFFSFTFPFLLNLFNCFTCISV